MHWHISLCTSCKRILKIKKASLTTTIDLSQKHTEFVMLSGITTMKLVPILSYLIYLSIYLSVCLSTHPPTDLPTYLPTYTFIYLSIPPSIHLYRMRPQTDILWMVGITALNHSAFQPTIVFPFHPLRCPRVFHQQRLSLPTFL